MVRKKLAMAVLALGALHAGVVSALGVGSVSIRSTLNQPLNAEIRLLDTGDLDADQIRVQLAAAQEFQRAGVDRDYFLTNLRFSVELDGRGGGVVRITTREPVIEPYLNFIVEARWPNGRLLREYAVLLDPPTFSEGSNAPFVPAGSSGLSTVQQARKVEPPRVTAEPGPPARTARSDMTAMPAAGPGRYRVQHNDTMSSIAARFRPAASVSTQQAMLAIQRANPDAFIRNNVNLVKSGYILRIPSAEEMGAIPSGEAVQELAAQNRAWRSGESYSRTAADGATGPQLDARPPTTAAEGGHREQAQLSIAAPGDSAKASAGEGAAGSGAGSAALRNELASAQEGLDGARRENQELHSRLDDMERQVATLQRLITLKDEQLAALQSRASGPAAGAVDAGSAPQPGAAAAAPPSPAGAADAAETAAARPAPAPAAQPKPQPAAAPEAATPGLLQRLTDNPLIPAGIAGLLLLALGGVYLARRRAAAEEEARALAVLALDEESDSTTDSEFSLDLDEPAPGDDAPIGDTPPVVAPAAEEPRQVRSETGDALAEADIYIAYGRYQQAVDLLSGAVEAEPERRDLRLKLLEVYLEMRNREAFRRQFVALQALGDSAAVDQVKEMLSSVDGVSDWLDDLPQGEAPSPVPVVAGIAGVAATVFDEPGAEFDLDIDDIAAGGEGAVAEEGGAFDLPDLDAAQESSAAPAQPFDFAPVEAPEQEAPEQAESALDLDFELGDELDAQATTDLPAADADTAAALDAGLPGLRSDLPADDDDLLELDLGQDDLDLALDGIGDEGGLEDLSSAFEPAAAAPVEFDLSDTAEELGQLDTFADLGGDEISTGDVGEPGDELADLSDLDLELPAELELPDEPEPVLPGEDDAFSDALSAGFEEPVAAEAGPGTGADESDFEMVFDEPLEAGFGVVSDEPLEAVSEEPFETVANEPFAAAAGEPADEPFRNSFDEPFEAAVPGAFGTAAEEPFGASAAESAVDVPVLEESEAEEFDFLADADEVATKLDLARAYIDMGDTDGARDILSEVMQEGTDVQKQEADSLLGRIG